MASFDPTHSPVNRSLRPGIPVRSHAPVKRPLKPGVPDHYIDIKLIDQLLNESCVVEKTSLRSVSPPQSPKKAQQLQIRPIEANCKEISTAIEKKSFGDFGMIFNKNDPTVKDAVKYFIKCNASNPDIINKFFEYAASNDNARVIISNALAEMIKMAFKAPNDSSINDAVKRLCNLSNERSLDLQQDVSPSPLEIFLIEGFQKWQESYKIDDQKWSNFYEKMFSAKGVSPVQLLCTNDPQVIAFMLKNQLSKGEKNYPEYLIKCVLLSSSPMQTIKKILDAVSAEDKKTLLKMILDNISFVKDKNNKTLLEEFATDQLASLQVDSGSLLTPHQALEEEEDKKFEEHIPNQTLTPEEVEFQAELDTFTDEWAVPDLVLPSFRAGGVNRDLEEDEKMSSQSLSARPSSTSLMGALTVNTVVTQHTPLSGISDNSNLTSQIVYSPPQILNSPTLFPGLTKVAQIMGREDELKMAKESPKEVSLAEQQVIEGIKAIVSKDPTSTDLTKLIEPTNQMIIHFISILMQSKPVMSSGEIMVKVLETITAALDHVEYSNPNYSNTCEAARLLDHLLKYNIKNIKSLRQFLQPTEIDIIRQVRVFNIGNKPDSYNEWKKAIDNYLGTKSKDEIAIILNSILTTDDRRKQIIDLGKYFKDFQNDTTYLMEGLILQFQKASITTLRDLLDERARIYLPIQAKKVKLYEKTKIVDDKYGEFINFENKFKSYLKDIFGEYEGKKLDPTKSVFKLPFSLKRIYITSQTIETREVTSSQISEKEVTSSQISKKEVTTIEASKKDEADVLTRKDSPEEVIFKELNSLESILLNEFSDEIVYYVTDFLSVDTQNISDLRSKLRGTSQHGPFDSKNEAVIEDMQLLSKVPCTIRQIKLLDMFLHKFATLKEFDEIQKLEMDIRFSKQMLILVPSSKKKNEINKMIKMLNYKKCAIIDKYNLLNNKTLNFILMNEEESLDYLKIIKDDPNQKYEAEILKYKLCQRHTLPKVKT